MKVQAARIAKLDAATSRAQYRDDFPPVFIVEDGPDLEDKIAMNRADLEAQGYDPDLEPLIIVLAPAGDEETRDLYRKRGVIVDDIPVTQAVNPIGGEAEGQ